MVELRCQNCGVLLSVQQSPSRCPNCGVQLVIPADVQRELVHGHDELEARLLSEHPIATWIRQRLEHPGQSLLGLCIVVLIGFLLIDDLMAHYERRQAQAPAPQAVAPPPIAPPTPRQIQPRQQNLFVSPTTTPSLSAASPETPAPMPAPSPPREPAPATPRPRAPFASLSDVRPIHRPSEPTGAALDELIGRSIGNGVRWLANQFSDNDFSQSRNVDEDIHGGLHALCTYALLQAGLAIDDPRLRPDSPFMAGLLNRLKQFPMESGKATYSRSLRVAALSLASRPEDRPAIDADADWLANASMQGAFTYTKPAPGATRSNGGWDNSNSQYGALGMWAASDAGKTAPDLFWDDVVNHWEAAQTPDGGWCYKQDGQSTLSMTAAGVSILFVARDLSLADAGVGGAPAPPPLSRSIERGLDWLDQADRVLQIDNGHTGYTLYGLERAGLASGYKYFGSHDWYLELARRCLKEQADDGHWDGGDQARAETAFRLLFLSRGRHPILVNKLRYDGHWSNRPRDVLQLAASASRRLERPLHFQVVGIDRSALEWSDCPVLYISGDQAFAVTDAQVANLKAFVEAGGLIFTHSDNNSEAFTGFAEGLARRLFGRGLEPLAADHPLYSAGYAMKNPPPLRAVGNGSRLLIVHSPQELNRHWGPRYEQRDPTAVETALNILLYAHGRREFRNRIDSLILPPPQDEPIATVPIARLRYDGNWDPEPGAWRHFANQFQRDNGFALTIKPIDAERLLPTDAPLAHLTGTQAVHLSDAALAAIERFVKAGGVLFIDDCGSDGSFAASIHDTLLAAVAPAPALSPMYLDDPILQGADVDPANPESANSGMLDATRPRLRQFALAKYGSAPNRFQVARIGHGTIVFCDIDLTSGLLGTDTWGIYGYTAAYAERFMNNLVLWTMHEARNAEPTANPLGN
jgi:hypothetical protein